MISLSLPGSIAAPALCDRWPGSCGEHRFCRSSLRAGVARLLARFPSTCKKRWEKVVGSKLSSAKVANGTRCSEARW
jgi:hypothetical protein